MTIESSVRNKVIEMHLNGKKRNEIAYDLNLSSIKISTGSISNIISEWRQGASQNQSTNEISTKSLTTTFTSTSAPTDGLSNTSLFIEDVKPSGQEEFQLDFAKGGPLSQCLQSIPEAQKVGAEDSTVEEEHHINLGTDWDKSLPQSATFAKP
jgi:hypothetical protein